MELVRRSIRVDSDLARCVSDDASHIICSESELYQLGAYMMGCLPVDLLNDFLEEFNCSGRVYDYELFLLDSYGGVR